MALYLYTDKFWTDVVYSSSSKEQFTSSNPSACSSPAMDRLSREFKDLKESLVDSKKSTTSSRPRRHPFVIFVGILLYLFFLSLFLYLLFFTLYYIASCPNIPKISFLVVILFLLSSSSWAFLLFIAYMIFIIYIGSQRQCQNALVHNRHQPLSRVPHYVPQPAHFVKKLSKKVSHAVKKTSKIPSNKKSK